jgi:hypothetical protein
MLTEISDTINLQPCLVRLTQLQHHSVDRLALQEATDASLVQYSHSPRKQLQVVADHLQLSAPRWLSEPDVAVMPILIYSILIYSKDGEHVGEWGILRGKNAQGQWISEWWDVLDSRWHEQADSELIGYNYARFKLSKPYVATSSPVYHLIKQEIFTHRKLIGAALIGGIMINIIAMTTSLYSMQIYDRVVPTGIEAKVNPVEIGQLKLNSPVAIKLDAFDYSSYGTLKGTLNYISADTLTEQGGSVQAVTYYRTNVVVDADKTKANPKLANVALKPGMTATVLLLPIIELY